jgi:CheY-like chemotaxis protein
MPCGGGGRWANSTNQHQSIMELCPQVSYVKFVQTLARSPEASCNPQTTGTKEKMAEIRPVITVVDDDESVRESLPDLLKILGFEARAFSSAQMFLASDSVMQTNCLILDIAMPGMSGPDLQQELKLRHQQIPTVFITARRDDSLRARLIQQGAVECLFKPFSEAALIDAIQRALK